MPLTIAPIPCLRDNYCYLIHSGSGSDAWLVDPSEPDAPDAALRTAGLQLRGVLATHHHHDHTGGIVGLLQRHAEHAPWVAGHAVDRGRIPGQTAFVDAPRGRFVATDLEVADCTVEAMHIPGHTRGAIAWSLRDEDNLLHVFTGDTLFAAGCGRLFEGTPAQMHASLASLVALPDDTRLWFGHEYTATNLRFAMTAEPATEAMATRLAALESRTTPTTVADEKATNPFVRAGSVEELARRRSAKDAFS